MARLAWSALGLVASASSDTGVSLSYIHCRDGNSWALADPEPVPAIGMAHGTANIVHLAWSTAGSDLACIDDSGRLSIWTHGAVLNLLACSMPPTPSPSSPDGAIVGFRWCTGAKSVVPTCTATRQDDGSFHYNITQIRPYGPRHATPNKHACIAVTANARLKFWYQVDTRYELSTIVDLEPDLAFAESYTVAAFGTDRDNTFVLATYAAATHTFKLFRISVDWPASTSPTSSPAAPVISARRIYCNQIYCPNSNTRDLTHIEIVSPKHHPESRLKILTVYASETATTVHKIEVLTLPMSLHSNFDTLSLRRTQALPDSSADIVQFKDYYDLSTKRLTGIFALADESAIALAFADGSIEFRHPDSFLPRIPAYVSHLVTGVVDAGLGFLPPSEPALEMCLSPNSFAHCYLTSKGDLKLQHISAMVAAEDVAEAAHLVAVSIAERHAVACMISAGCEDIMLVACDQLRLRGPEFAITLLAQCQKALSLSLEARDAQAERFVLSPHLQKLLSFQAALLSNTDWQRTVPGKVVWATLNVRLFAFAITFTLKSNSGGRQASGQLQDTDVRPETLVTLLGLVKWCVDFLAFMLQDIFEIACNPEQYVKRGNSSVALSILLCGVPRLILRYALRGLRGLEQIVSRSSSREPDEFALSRVAFRQLGDIMRSGPLAITSFEKLVSDIDTYTKSMPVNSLEVDQTLLFKGTVPPELASATMRVCAVFMQRIKPELDLQALYFYPTDWLGLGRRGSSFKTEIGLEIDNLRKQILSPQGVHRRRCVRCGSMSTLEDFKGVKATPHWTLVFQRNCICGSAWVKSDNALHI
ncbi:mediator complex, subunit Med16 [Limtongia smithiae]|uniref:mediator complex, subunit Med16 n=1 Tax=Limtongia smithiae TaxID=1125753 RepID=UPI0034CD30FA